jgi:hypothetical protein
MGEAALIKGAFLAIGLVASLTVAASAGESQAPQTSSQKAQAGQACRSKCEAQYKEDKCTEGVAPMHSPCEAFNQCLSDCD